MSTLKGVLSNHKKIINGLNPVFVNVLIKIK